MSGAKSDVALEATAGAGKWPPLLSVGFPLAVAVVVVAVDLLAQPKGHADLSGLVVSTLVCGSFAMVLIETVKRMAPVRALFQRRRAHRRIMLRLDNAQFNDSAISADAKAAVAEMFRSLGEAAVDGAFNLPVEQMIPQLADALDLTVVRPRRNHEATTNAAASEAVSLRAALFGSPFDRSDQRARSTPVGREEREAARFLEQLQIEIGNRWRQYVRSLAACIAGLAGLLLAYWDPPDIAVSVATPIVALLAGGFIAWLARDVVAVVERWRR